MDAVRISVLGPVELWAGERLAALGGPKQRALLALLALEWGQIISRDRAAHALWGESLSEAHTPRLHTVVSRLRAAIREAGGPSDVIETTSVGYRLCVEAEQVDAARAAVALRDVRSLRVAGRTVEAAALAGEALGLWRGRPLADVTDDGWASADLRRLDELKLSLMEEGFDCRLALGASPELVEELEAASLSAPLRERLHAELVLALAATGRRTDALDAYDRVRRRLADELGIDPGTVLREAHRSVLEPGPVGLAAAPRRQPAARGGDRRRVVAAAFAVAGAVAAAVALLVPGGTRRAPSSLHPHAGELVIATPDLRRIVGEIPLSGTIINEQPGGIVIANGSLWSVTEQGTVTQVDIARRRIVGSTPLALPAGPGGMAVGFGATWVTDSGAPVIYRLGSGVTTAKRMRLPPLKPGSRAGTGGIAVANGSLWVVRSAGAVDRVSRDGRLEHRFVVPGAAQIVSDGRAIWVISPTIGVVTRLDPSTNTVRARTRLRPILCCATLGGGSAWVTTEAGGLLWQLGRDGSVRQVIHVPAPATEVAYAGGAVWVSGYTGGTVTRVDVRTLDVRTTHIDEPVAGLAAAPGVVAFSTFASERAALAGVRGPVARIVLSRDLVSDSDPAAPIVHGDRDADWQALSATCLSLYEYRGGALSPFAASGPALQRANGRVWTIRVRHGFAFSPPATERVDAGTFRMTIERSTAPAFRQSEAAKALANVVGMDAYRRGLTRHVAGLESHGDRLTIRLRRPVPDLDAQLAAPYFCAVPKDTPAIPAGVQSPLPSAGPYYVAGASGGAFTVLRRNPHYPWRTHPGFDAFVYEFNVDQRRALDMIRHGQADYAAFYGSNLRSQLAAQLGASGDALGVRFRISPRPGGPRRSVVGELFGRRLGCRSYNPLYAGVDLKTLCPTMSNAS